MKKVTLFAIMMAFTFGVFAQLDRQNGENLFLKPAKYHSSKVVKSIDTKSSSATITNVITEEVQADENYYAGFKLSFTVTMNEDATKYYCMVNSANSLENYVDTSSTYSTMEEYLLAYANYLQGQNQNPYKTENQELTYSGLYGNVNYEIYVLVVGSTDDDAVVITETFNTPSSNMSGTPEITINKTEYTDQGAIEWEASLNNNVKEYYFICEKNSDARYYIEQGYAEEQGYKEELTYWVNSRYSQYFIFDSYYDINEYFNKDFINNTTYEVGTEYCYMSLPINGNRAEGNFKYVIFTYGEGVGLNDVEKFVNTNIYPNPTTEILNISSEININTVELYNSLGQVVLTKEVNANEVMIPVSNLDKGAYLVKAYSKDMVISQKVMVK